MKEPLSPQFDDLSNPDTIISTIQESLRVLKDNQQPDKKDLSELLKSLEIKATDKLEPPKVAIEQINQYGRSILGTLGNFMLVIGKAKSRKSFLINLIVSIVLMKSSFLGLFEGRLPKDKRVVLYFDTEQGKYHVQLALKRICQQLSVSIPENLIVYGLRSLKPSERLKAIEYAIQNTPNLGLVVIDGIKDLINSINDEEEATKISSFLLKYTEELDIHIVTVLHQNKGDTNARGHLGTELVNKAETVLSVTVSDQDKDISIVEAEQCRNREPEPFAFEINEDGLPVLVEDFEARTRKPSKKDEVSEMGDMKIYSLLKEVYSYGNSFSYANLVIQLQLAYKSSEKESIGNNKAKELLVYCRNNGWIEQAKDRAPYTLSKLEQNE